MRNILIALLFVTACSPVRHVFTVKTLNKKTVPKHVAVLAWAPKNFTGLDTTLAAIGADFVKQYKNYIVHEHSATTHGWNGVCRDVEGVIQIRTLEANQQTEEFSLNLAIELYDCRDGELIFRAETTHSDNPLNQELQQLTNVYTERLGKSIQPFVTTVFTTLQPLVRKLPDPPPPTDEELMQMVDQ